MLPFPQFIIPFNQRPVDRFSSETGVYIGDLHDAVSLEYLYYKFKDFGEIKYIKLHRYPFLGISKHFGFIYYSSPEEAQQARREMNYTPILGKSIRVTTLKYYDKDANLFFLGFPSDASLKEVESFFQIYGFIVSVQFSYDEKKKSRGYGWVQFESKQSAEQLLAAEDLIFKDKKIVVKQFIKKGKDGREDKKNNIYVKNFWKPLEPSVDFNAVEPEIKQKIEELFGRFGQIISICVKIDNNKRAPFAFVSFIENSAAKNAIFQFSKRTQENKDPFQTGKEIYVNWAQSRSERKRQFEGTISDRYIFLQNLRQDVSEESLKQLLSQYGEIQTIRLDRITQPMMYMVRIGYIVFKQAVGAAKLVKTYYQNAALLSLFENNPIVTNLFLPSWKKREMNRRRFPFPGPRPQGPGPVPPGPVPVPVPPGPRPLVQSNLEDDIKKVLQLSESDQRRQFGQMLHRLILKRKPQFDINKTNKIVGMLIDENFSIDEIIEFITLESEFNERIKEAEEILAEDQ